MKLRRKLLSAGFALGATALTLTTSTFAWYTSNTSVESKTISGATSAQADSSSLFIANAKTYNGSAPGAAGTAWTAFATEVTPVVIASDQTHVLEPVAFTAVSTSAPLTYNTMSVSGDDKDQVKYTAISSATSIYEYVLRFQIPNNAAATPVYISSLSVTNSVSASTSQQLALADNTTLNVADATAATAVGIKETGNYNVDLLHSLKMTVVAQALSFDASEKTFSASGNAITTIYDLDGFADASKDVNIATTANAVGYYNAVLGTNISYPGADEYLSASVDGIDAVKCVASAAKSAVESGDANATINTLNTLFTMPSGIQYMEVRFTFWLDGWDSFCYDTCRKQAFSVNMSFDTKNKGLVAATAATGKAAA
jgi:hypothetical protein